MSLKKTHRFEPKNDKPGRIYEWEKIIYKSELSKVYKGQMRTLGRNVHEKVCYVVIEIPREVHMIQMLKNVEGTAQLCD